MQISYVNMQQTLTVPNNKAETNLPGLLLHCHIVFFTFSQLK